MKKRMLAGLMAACILWTTLPAYAFQEDGPAEPAAALAVADGDTRYGYKNVLGEDATSTQNAGRMWVDHTVSTANSLTFDGVESKPITREEGEDFLVTYSALSSTSEVSILPDTTPSDTIFVLDFSMTMNRNMNGDYVTDEAFNTTRTKAMLDSMDETIATLKASNPNNRVGIVTFCGLSDVLLPLTKLGDITAIDEDKANAEIPVTGYGGDKPVIYTTENRFFSVSKSIPGGNNRNWVRCNIQGGEVNMLSDYTSMQAGLYEALKMFRGNWDEPAQDLGNRRANVIVITDGDSNTLAKQIDDTPWYENMTTDAGEYRTATGGNLAFATLLTASYLKYEAEQRYESCSMYTVGLSTTELMQLLLNPSEYMKEHPSDSTVTSTQSLWNQYKNGTNPPNISGITFTPAKDDAGNIVPESYYYVDAFFDTSNADELADAFRTITEEIILAEAQPPTDVDDSKPAKSGYVTYTAPLGEYMEVKDFKGILFGGTWFTEKTFSSSSDGTTTYVFEGSVVSPAYGKEPLSDIVIQVKQTDPTHQTVTIQIPASVMPMRSNTIRLNSFKPDEVKSHETEDNAPMRIVYSVGLMDEVDRKTLAGVSPEYIEENTAEDGTVLFYCNAYDKQKISEDKTVGSVTAEFTAGNTNPFYYAPAGTVLYTDQTGTVATVYQKGETYYVKQDYYCKDEHGASIYKPGWLGRSDLKEDDTKVEALEDGSEQLVLSRSILKQVHMEDARTEKNEGNRSETADYSYYATERTGNPGEFLAYLGNNGRLGLENPLGELAISKTVQAAEGENLPENAEDTEFTLKLTAVRDDNVPLTGTFFCEVYNDENPNTASGSSVTFDASGAAALAIKSGQVIRLFLPKGISITVSETPPNEYTVSYKDDNTAAAGDTEENFTADIAAADIQVINTFAAAKIDIPVEKVWNDNEDQDGIRPESITVKLLADGQETEETLTLSSGNNWTGTFTELDEYRDGEKISYSIKEDTVEGYETSVTGDAATGFTITNTHTPEMISISGRKTWDDAGNQDRKRPESITIRLYADGMELTDKMLTVRPDSNGDWTWSFENLPKYANGTEIVYTISEDAVPGYTTEVNGFNVTNSYTPGKTNVTVTKSWNDAGNQDGLRPAEITVELLENGEPTGKTLKLSEETRWTGTFSDLDEYKDGEIINYTIKEVSVDGYDSVVTGTAATGFVITNSHTPAEIDISGIKTWEDADNQDGKRPDSITIRLCGNGDLKDSVTVTAEDGWKWSFTDLPKYANGTEIVYTISEDAVPGYTSNVDGFNVTNSYTTGKTSVTVTKSWNDAGNQDGLRPAEITVELLENGKPTGKTLKLSEETRWMGTFSDLDEYKDGEKIVYSVKEVSVNGYDSVVTGTAATGFVITNSHTPAEIDISGIKTWEDADNQDGKRPDSITIRLYGNGDLKDSVTVTAEDGWKWSFTDLPKYANGTEIVYTISEDAVPGYTSNVDGFNVTNSYTPGKTSVTVTKSWNDAGNQDGLRPAEITVELLENGKPTGKTLKLSKETRWMGTFSDLDEYKDGEKIVYSVKEVSVKGYDSSVTGNATTGFVITNSHTPAKIDLSGSKTWDDADNQDGKRPESITIRLYANGKQVEVVTVTAEDGWKWSFANLPKNESGSEIRYTITEDAVPGYQSEVNGMDVTNHYTPGKINIPVTKNWQDKNDADGIRPDSITVKLYADGKDTGKELVLDQENNWTASFDALDEYADGVKISYTIAEVEVDGYDTSISGSAETGFVINNSHTPDTPDEPDDPDDPDEPGKPTDPDDPDEPITPTDPDEPDKPNPPKDDTPQTGDTTNLALWIGLLAISATGFTATLVLGKKKRYRGKHMR